MNQDADRLIALLTGDTDRIRSLSEAEWDEFIAYAKKSQVAQTLFTYLKAHEITPQPAAAESIRNIHLASASRSMKLFHELRIIIKAFQREGVTAIPLKGAWLAEAAYQNIAIRGMGDVDLWIQRSQLDTARKVMSSLGYSSRSKTDRPQALQDELAGETQMFKTGKQMVELHWNVFPG